MLHTIQYSPDRWMVHLTSAQLIIDHDYLNESDTYSEGKKKKPPTVVFFGNCHFFSLGLNGYRWVEKVMYKTIFILLITYIILSGLLLLTKIIVSIISITIYLFW